MAGECAFVDFFFAGKFWRVSSVDIDRVMPCG